MLQTLDSIEHVVACLQEKHKGKRITVSPIITRDFTDMVITFNIALDEFSTNPNRMFFGVITVGNLSYFGTIPDGVLNLVLLDDYQTDGDIPNHFVVGENSQIIELFYGFTFGAGGWTEIPTAELNNLGQFRGFEIIID